MKLTEFTQTPFITHDERMQIRMAVADWDYCNPFRVKITAEDKTLYEGPMYKDRFTVLIPVPEKTTECTVMLTPFEDMPVISGHTLRPPKRWRIGLVYSSHEDIGYCAYANKLEYESYLFLKDAMRLCREHEGFRYMIEHVWWLEAFERYADDSEKEELYRLVREEKIELNAIHCGYHTHWAEGEQLIRNVEFATKGAAKRIGKAPTAAIFTDISGMSWQCIPAFAGQGIRYTGILQNGFRKPNLKGNPPPLFRWRAQNGRDSLLCWHLLHYRFAVGGVWCSTNRQYPEGTFFFDETRAMQTESILTDVLTPLENAPYDIFPFSFYDDREKPTTMLLTVCEFMNKRWKFPRFSMEIPSVMFREIEAQSGDRLPEITGDMPDQWADFASISPEWMGIKRNAMRNLLPAEMLETLRAMEGGEYHAHDFNEAVRCGGLFDEHCWATSSKHPQKMHLFNLNYVKRHSAEKALRLTEASLRRSIGEPGAEFSLVNPLPEARCQPLFLSPDSVPEGIAAQTAGDRVITTPMEFAPMEAKRFARRTAPIPAAMPSPECFETDFYLVKTNALTHSVESIIEKSTGRELIDKNAPYAFGEYIYVTAADKTDSSLAFEVPKRRKFTVEEGEAAFVITRIGYEEQSGADVTARYIFHKHSPDIDLDLRFELATGLMGDFYERYKKAIFFALPLKVENHRFYTQLAGGMAHEMAEKMQICPLDYTVAEEWIAVENETGGIGIRSESVPLFHLSQINYNRFMATADFPHSHVYLYAASNRTNNLNFRTPADCHGEFRLTLRPYSGHCGDALPKWSRALAKPPIAGAVTEIPRLSVDSDVRLLGFRPASSDEIEVRFSEESGKSRENVGLTLPFAPTSAMLTTLDGKDIAPLAVSGNTVRFDIPAGGTVTLRIRGDFRIALAEEKVSEISDVLVVPVENRRAIVSFEKAAGLNARAFRILGDGALLAEIENAPEAVQTAEIDCRPASVQIEILY